MTSLANLSASNLLGGVLFSSLGFGAFIYGKKQHSMKPLIIGIILMAYPFFVTNTIALYAVGALLTVLLFTFNG